MMITFAVLGILAVVVAVEALLYAIDYYFSAMVNVLIIACLLIVITIDHGIIY